MTYTRLALLAPLLAAAAIACKPSKPAKSGTVLANVGNDVITSEEFKKRLDETSPFLRARYNTPERKKEFLENLIKNELLAQEAERRGLQNSPAVAEVTRRAMVQELLRQQLDEKLTGADIPEVELKGFYDSHVEDYVKPERIRINHLLVAAKEGDASARTAARAKAQKLLEDIKAREAKGELNAFQVVTMKESNDPQSAPVGGDVRYLSKVEMAKELGAPVADAVFQMVKPGDKAGPVETTKGYEIVKLQNRTVALDKKFEDVKDLVRQRMARERRNKDYDDFLKKLREQGKVKVHDEELAKIPNPEPGPGMPFPGMAGRPMTGGQPPPMMMHGGQQHGVPAAAPGTAHGAPQAAAPK
jgi:peptidyl-prolyl cis-trans isomerase C